MGNIEIENYNNYDDFKNNLIGSNNNYNFTIAELISYAISAGGFSNRSVGPSGQVFYESLVQMALIDGTNFSIGEDYKYSETSIKTSISFFMGMIAAKAVADKKYNIKYLFHLKDPQICFSTSGKTPDFFGLQNGTDPVLFEAKGTFDERPTNKTVENAKTQLDSISSIELDGWPYEYNTFSKHVIASCFKNDILTYLDIDPNEVGDTKLTIYIDKAIILYYRNIMNLLLTKQTKSQTIKDSTYLVTELGNYTIGLNKEVFNKLSEYESLFKESQPDFKKINTEGLYKKILSIDLQLAESENKEYALRPDGILCI